MKLTYTLSALGLGASVAYAQSTACNPLTASTCSPDPALGKSISVPFDEESSYFERYATNGNVSYGDDGVEMTINKRLDNPSLVSEFYIMFGKVQAIAKAAGGQGIISSFYLQSDDLDEIDIEWTGTDTTQVQSNFFSKGETTTFDRGAFHSVDDPQGSYHNYTIDWTKDEINIYVDSALVRTITSDNGQGYPESPMRIFTGIWAGGDSQNEPGTIEWAGGLTDYTKAPFSMYLKDVIVVDYSTGTEYSYSGTDGTWESIEAKDGEVYGRYDQGVADFDELASGGSVSDDTSSSSSSSSTSSSSTKTSASPSTSKSSSTSSSSSSSSSSSASSSSSSLSSSSPTTTSKSSTTVPTTSTESTLNTTSASSTSASSSSITALNTTSSSTSLSSSSTQLNTTESLITSTEEPVTTGFSSLVTTTAADEEITSYATGETSSSAALTSTQSENAAAFNLPQLLAIIPALLLL